MVKKTFVAKDGKVIHYKEWTLDNPKGLLQISHGMAESTSRYEEFAQFMANNGYLVFADDHRGHGETDNSSGYVEGDMFYDTLSDISELTLMYKKAYPNLKVVLFGHSYGSFLTQAYIENYGEYADGFIVGGSAYMKGVQVTGGKVIAILNCLFGKGKKQAKLIAKLSFGTYNKKYNDGTTFISSVKEECERYENNPDCNFILSNAFYKSMFCAFKDLYGKVATLKINSGKPILLISGKDDPVGNYGRLVEKLYRFYKEKAKVKSVEKVLYDKVRHEYLNDISKEDAKNKILNFCNSVCK